MRVALDANLLLLLVVGATARRFIRYSKRLGAYREPDFDLVLGIIRSASELIVTPNVLTEVSNLAPQGISEPGASEVGLVLADLARRSREVYVPSRDAVERPEYRRLGLTDAVLMDVALTGAVLWTDDLALYLAAAERGVPSCNFTYLRRERGLL